MWSALIIGMNPSTKEKLFRTCAFFNSDKHNLKHIFIPGAVEHRAVQPYYFQVAVRVLCGTDWESWAGLVSGMFAVINDIFKAMFIRLVSLNNNRVFLLFIDNATVNSIFMYGYWLHRKLNVIASTAVKTGLPIGSQTVLDNDVNGHISQMENPLLNSTGKLKIYWYGYCASVCESTGSRCTFSFVEWVYPSG